jgi:hypothetical protein
MWINLPSIFKLYHFVYQILAEAVEQRVKSWATGVLFPGGARYFIPPHNIQTGSGRPPSILLNGYCVFLPCVLTGRREAGLPLPSKARTWIVELCVHCSICLHTTLLKKLRTGTTYTQVIRSSESKKIFTKQNFESRWMTKTEFLVEVFLRD